jgi:signal transduction histidine kinase
LPVASAVAGLAAVVAVVTVVMTRHEPAYSYAGTSPAGRLGLVAAGLSLVAAGLGFWLRRPGAWFGPLLVAGGFAWFVLEWNNPGVPSSAAFTTGLVLYASCPAFVGHAVLSYTGARRSLRVQRIVVASTYVATILVLGLLPAFLFDPNAACNECARNLLLISAHNPAADRLLRIGLWLGVVCISALVLLVVVEQLRSSVAARRAHRLVVATGTIYLALVAALFASSLGHGVLWQDDLQRRFWRAQAVALVALALGAAWSWAQARRSRAAVAQLVVELAQAPPPGGLRHALAVIVGDPALELAYPREDSERLVDLQGRSAHLSPEKEQTTLVGGGQRLAVVAHAPGAFGDEQLVADVATAARLALENERLQAEVRSRLEELRESRTRIVEAGDAERRRLEHDLHDGAQQHLVSVALALRLLRTQLPRDTNPQTVQRLNGADADLRAAIEELRELAHGIFPAVLADGGIGAAVSALAEEARVPVRLDALPDERYRPAVELAAYLLVAETVAVATGSLVVRGARSNRRLQIEINADGVDELPDRTDLDDRVAAADGYVTLEQSDGAVRIVAEFPCAS